MENLGKWKNKIHAWEMKIYTNIFPISFQKNVFITYDPCMGNENLHKYLWHTRYTRWLLSAL